MNLHTYIRCPVVSFIVLLLCTMGRFAWTQELLPSGIRENRIEYRDESGCGLRIAANIPDAEVFLDGEYQGTTPLYISGLVPGVYHITLEKRGYEARDFIARFADGTIRDFYIEMKSITGFVRFDVEPRNAQIVIDGEQYGTLVELPEGAYTAEIRLFGYESAHVPFSIFRYRTQYVSVQLHKAIFRVSDLKVSPSRFNPQSPGSLGICDITFSATSPGTAILSVLDNGKEIRRFQIPVFRTWTQNVSWNGTDSSGSQVADGTYQLVLNAESSGENGSETLIQSLETEVTVDSSVYYPLASLPSFAGGFSQPDIGRLLPAGTLCAGLSVYPFFGVAGQTGYAALPVLFHISGAPADWIEMRASAGFSVSPFSGNEMVEYIAASVKAGLASSLYNWNIGVRYGYSGGILLGDGRADMGQGLGVSLAGGIKPGPWYIGGRTEYLWGINRGFLNDGTMLWKNSLLVEYQRGSVGASTWAALHSYFAEQEQNWISAVSFGFSVSILPGNSSFVLAPGFIGLWTTENIYLAPSFMFSIVW